MIKNINKFKKSILNSELSRPNWTRQVHRSLNKQWLDKNECTNPKLNKIVLECLSSIPPESVFSYPDLDVLYAKIALFSKVQAENILLTAGSDGAIRACFETCTEPGDKIVLTRPTFAMYEIYSKIYDLEVTWLDYNASEKGPLLPVDTFISVIRKVKPKMVCIPNPDSPTGTIFSPDDLEKIINISGEVGALILIDEAYHPIYHWTAVPLIYKYNHLVVVRSFSKAWGAAGLRVGYAIANNKLIILMHKQRPMYEIGSVSAQTIGILLDHKEDMLQSVEEMILGKEYFQNEMKKIGFSTYKSYGNFFHIKFGKYAEQIHNELEDKVYYRKDFDMPCLDGYSRFSATTKEKFKPIISCIVDVVNQNKKNFLE
jgi:histidinol-phosphate aminotransferase